MNANFLLILLCATMVSGIIMLIDKFFWKPKRLALSEIADRKQPKMVEYARSFFPVFLIVLIIRAFIVQLFVVPTGSLEPTIMPRAYIVVNQFAYGLRFPIWDWKILPVSEPDRGDIVLFHSPVVPHMDLIKRVVGVPGDRISYVDKVLYVNGERAEQTPVTYTTDSNGADSPVWTVQVVEENLLGVKHGIYLCPPSSTACFGASNNINFYNLVVPAGYYFMMGDNRDNSDDSRYWGFVPEKNIMGKGSFVLFSWDSNSHWFRDTQFFKSL